MSANKKRTISVRLNASDLKKLKDIAKRLQVRESDVFRFAVRTTLAKLGPLHDLNNSGADLLPVFLDHGKDLTNYFNIDVSLLDEIFNNGIDNPSKRIAREDIEMIIMAETNENYVVLKLQERSGKITEAQTLLETLKMYLCEKYIMQAEKEIPAQA